MESAQKLLADLFTTGNPQPIYEAFLDQDQIDAEVLSSIVQKIKKEKGDFASVDEVTEKNADKTKFAGSINLAKGTVKFEIEVRGNKIRNLSFGLGQEPESISSKIVTTRATEFITLFLTRNSGARALMSEIFCELMPMHKLIHDMHMETNRIGFGNFKSAKTDVTADTLTLDKTTGVPSVTLNYVVEFESATTTADVTFGVTGLRAEVKGYNFATSVISGGKMTEGQGKQQAALVLQTLFAKKIDEFLSGSLHRDFLSMFDAKILEWHVKDLTDSIGAFKAPIDEQKIGFEEEIKGDHVTVMGKVSAANSDLVFTFEWNKCIMSAFNWAVEDKSVYLRSSLDLHRAYFETKTTAFLETTKSSWIGSSDDDIMPDLRLRDEMNSKMLDLRDLLDLDEVLETEYEDNPEVFTINGFEREVVLKTKVKLGDRVLVGTVKWFVDQLRAYITEFEFTKTAEDSAAPIDIDDILAGLNSAPAAKEDKWDKMNKFDFNWDD